MLCQEIKRSSLSLVTMESCQEDNKHVFECFYQSSLLIMDYSLSSACLKQRQTKFFKFLVVAYRGKINRQILTGRAERWPQPLNRGGHCTDNFLGTLTTGCLIGGGRFMCGSLIRDIDSIYWLVWPSKRKGLYLQYHHKWITDKFTCLIFLWDLNANHFHHFC